jgi:hypothetical protein
MTYDFTFEQRQGNADYGKLVLEGTLGGGDDILVNVFVDLISPTGISINTHNFAVPDLAVATTAEKKWDIPTDANGDYVRGTYTIRIYEEQTVSAAGATPLVISESYYYQAFDSKSNLSWSEVCVPGVVGVLTLVDAGDYSALLETSREMKIVFPPQENLPDLTGTGTSLSINPHWTNVDYVGSVTVEYYSQNDDMVDLEWFEQYGWSQQVIKHFACSSCEITECVNEYATKVAAKACTSTADNEKIAKLTLYEIAYRNAKQCGNLADAATWADKIKTLLGCDCGCSESGEPAPFETAIFDDLLSTAVADAITTTDWVSIPNGSLQNSWQSNGTFSGGSGLRWRRVGDNWIELSGDITKNGGLTPGIGSIFLVSSLFGVDLLPFHTQGVHMTQNSGVPVIEFGGNVQVDGSGNIALYPATSVTPAGIAGFAFHLLLPIEP